MTYDESLSGVGTAVVGGIASLWSSSAKRGEAALAAEAQEIEALNVVIASTEAQRVQKEQSRLAALESLSKGDIDPQTLGTLAAAGVALALTFLLFTK